MRQNKTKPTAPKKKEEVKFTFVANLHDLDKLKAIAFWERTSMKDIINNLIEDFLNQKGEEYIENVMSVYQVRKE